MSILDRLLEKNAEWAERLKKENPNYFSELARDQHPEVLWIGCSDSRVPANEIIQQHSGDIFVHRNIANLVLHSDMNCQSVLQYAVEVLKVNHIIVCGHYGCGGIKSSLQHKNFGLIDNWLRNIRELYKLHQDELDQIEDENTRINRLSEINVQAQVHNICENPFVQHQWERGRALWVHGWIYDMKNGLLRDLEMTAGRDTPPEEIVRL